MVGIHKVFPQMKAGDVGSQAVYPRASKVFRIPPLGKLEASGYRSAATVAEERAMGFSHSHNDDPAVLAAIARESKLPR